jgi:hypothetical protein
VFPCYRFEAHSTHTYSVVDHLLASAVKPLVRLLILEVVVLNLGRNRCILAVPG